MFKKEENVLALPTGRLYSLLESYFQIEELFYRL